jgi:hypothetical protein
MANFVAQPKCWSMVSLSEVAKAIFMAIPFWLEPVIMNHIFWFKVSGVRP